MVPQVPQSAEKWGTDGNRLASDILVPNATPVQISASEYLKTQSYDVLKIYFLRGGEQFFKPALYH